MTIQAILRRAVTLLGAAEGEPDATGRRQRLLAALDSGLGEISRSFPIQARCKITIEDGQCPLPSNVMTPRGLYQEGKRVPLQIEDGKIIGENGRYTLVYYRKPPVASELGEQTVLPYPEDLLRALPFYCAALLVMGEDHNLYNQLMEQYNTKLASALGYRPVAGVESRGCL